MLMNQNISSKTFYRDLKTLIMNASNQELIQYGKKISKHISSIIGKKILFFQSQFHQHNLPQLFNVLNKRLEQISQQNRKYCSPLYTLRDKYKKLFGVQFQKPQQNYQQTQKQNKLRQSKLNPIVKQYYEEEQNRLQTSPKNQSKKKFMKLQNQGKINSIIQLIQKQQVKLPSFQCLGCSSTFYKQWPLTNQMTLETPLIVLQDYEQKQIQNSICAGLNSRNGATILVGCNLKQNDKGKKLPYIQRIKKNNFKCLSYRQNFKQRIMRSLSWYKPLTRQNKSIVIDYVKIYQNPLKNQQQWKYSFQIIPRIKVKQLNGNHPVYLQIQRKSYTHLYYYFNIDQSRQNMFKCKQLTGTQIYKFVHNKYYNKNKVKKPHFNSQCLKASQLQIDQYKSQSFSQDKQYQLKNIFNNKDCYQKQIAQQIKKYRYCTIVKFILKQKTLQAQLRKKQIQNLQQQLTTSRVQFQKFKIRYQTYWSTNNGYIVNAYLIVHNQSLQLVNQIMNKLNLNKKNNVDIEAVTQELKLINNSTTHKSRFKKWKEFRQYYQPFYPLQTLTPFYTQNKENDTKTYIDFTMKEMSILGYLILDYMGYRSSFVSQKIVEEKDRKYELWKNIK